jgi:hypothetical protein
VLPSFLLSLPFSLFCLLASQVGLFPLRWFKFVWINSYFPMDQLLVLELVGFRGLGLLSWRVVCLDARNCNIEPDAIKCRHRIYWI